jgi:hypothetical protein
MGYPKIASDRIRVAIRCRLRVIHHSNIGGSGGTEGGTPERVKRTDKPLLLALGRRNLEFRRAPQAPQKVQTQRMFSR